MATFITSFETWDLMSSIWTKNYVYIFTKVGPCNTQVAEHFHYGLCF